MRQNLILPEFTEPLVSLLIHSTQNHQPSRFYVPTDSANPDLANYLTIISNRYSDPDFQASELLKLNPKLTETDVIFGYYSALSALRLSANVNELVDPSTPLAPEIYTVLQTINQQLAKDKPSVQILQSAADAQKGYKAWYSIVQSDYAKEQVVADRILRIQQKLIQVQPRFALSALRVTTSTRLYNMLYTPPFSNAQREPKIYDGLDIFNQLRVSKDIPIAKYVDQNSKSYYKLFESTTDALDVSKTLTPNTIYLRLNSGTTSVREDFFLIIVSLAENYVRIRTQIGADVAVDYDTQNVFLKVKAALPNVTLNAGDEIRITGEFDILGGSYNEILLLDTILNDEVFSAYVYVDETARPAAFQSRFNLKYQPFYLPQESSGLLGIRSSTSSVAVTLSQVSGPSGQLINVRITHADSRALANKFMLIFSDLLKYYQSRAPELAVKYTNRGIDVAKVAQLVEIPSIVPETTTTRGAASTCPKDDQPVLVNFTQANQWKRGFVINRQGRPVTNNQAMEYPPGSGRYWICNRIDPHTGRIRYPYPGLMIKDDGVGVDKFVPCCYAKDKISGLKGGYGAMITGIMPEPRGARGSVTLKVLESGVIGNIPPEISRVLSNYAGPSLASIKRLGTLNIAGTNSILHCIMVAIDDPNYFALPVESREAFVQRIRLDYLTKMEPNVFRQELYDYSDDEITSRLMDLKVNLDPDLFYRGLEELFRINIYVFSIPRERARSEAQTGFLDIPRHRLFHARPNRQERPCIIIFRNWGTESDRLEYPHCELLVSEDPLNRSTVRIFGADMNNLCHDILTQTQRTLTWNTALLNTEPVSQARSDLYYYLDYEKIFAEYNIIRQYIDASGKLRALTLNVDKYAVTVMVLPGQPLNYPQINHIDRSNLVLAEALLDVPSGVTRNATGELTGLWYRLLDVEFGLYLPLVPTRDMRYDQVPTGPLMPLIVHADVIVEINQTQRIHQIQRVFSIFSQLLRYLYAQYYLGIPEPRNPESAVQSFFAQYVTVDDVVYEDSLEAYDVSRVPRILPRVLDKNLEGSTRVDLLIQGLSNISPGLFRDGKLRMYSPEFAARMYSMLLEYTTTIDPRTYISEEYVPIIRGYYLNNVDFVRQPGTTILIGDSELSEWRSTAKSGGTLLIKDHIELSQSRDITPKLYRDGPDIFIVQNTTSGSLEAGLAVGWVWINERINPGGNLDIPSQQAHRYIVYTLENGIAQPIQRFTDLAVQVDTDVNVPRLLYYGTSVEYERFTELPYAALLPIS